MDEFFAVVGVLFVIFLVAQIFQKPERRTTRRAARGAQAQAANHARYRSRTISHPARIRLPIIHYPLLRGVNRLYRWFSKPLRRSEATVAGYVTLAGISIVTLVYLINALLHTEKF